MDDFIVVVLAGWIVIATLVTAQFAVLDYREFDVVVKQCEKQGFIQNTKTRIMCKLEEK
jgi:hypothetical protein